MHKKVFSGMSAIILITILLTTSFLSVLAEETPEEGVEVNIIDETELEENLASGDTLANDVDSELSNGGDEISTEEELGDAENELDIVADENTQEQEGNADEAQMEQAERTQTKIANMVSEIRYIYFGSWPQKIVSDDEIERRLDSAEFDENGLTILDGVKYWDSGRSYYKCTPIKWRVLQEKEGAFTLLADKILDTCAYHKDGLVGKNTKWENSDVRAHLNGPFYNKAFSEDEKNDIKISYVSNARVSDHGLNGGADTEDKVYLLSWDELKSVELGFPVTEEITIDREAKYLPYLGSGFTTSWVGDTSQINSEKGTAYYWTRSPEVLSYGYLEPGFVSANGSLSHGGSLMNGRVYCTWKLGLRPVIQLPIESELWSDTDPELKKGKIPIVVVPGVMGSNLFTKNGDKLWDPKGLQLFSAGKLDLKTNPILYTRGNAKDMLLTPDADREYGALNTYKGLIDALCKEFPDRKIYISSYDFRQSNEVSANNLARDISLILEQNNADKVDVVAHSMGGLVTSSYAKQYGYEKVRKIITCGTPYEGSPLLLDRALGERLTDSEDIVYMGAEKGMYFLGLNTEVKTKFPALAELIPTRQYYEKYPWFQEKKDFKKTTYTEMSYEDFDATCTKIFLSNMDAAVKFHEGLKSKNYNHLVDYPDSYFIVGYGQDTMTYASLDEAGKEVVQPRQESNTLGTIPGDGTVPLYSATMCGKLRTLNFESDVKRVHFIKTNHGGTCGGEGQKKGEIEALNTIFSILKDEEAQSEIIEEVLDERTNIYIECPVEVSVSKGQEILDSSLDNFSQEASFGSLLIYGRDADKKLLSLKDEAFDIQLDGAGYGTMDLTLEWWDANNNLVDTRKFLDVPITENTKMNINTENSQTVVLYIDDNGDGTIDKELSPLLFTDVSTEDWFYSSVKFVSQRGIMTGLNPTFFGATENLARAQFAALLYKLEGSPSVEYDNRFSDVADGQWYTKPILWAAQNGIVNGYKDGRFGVGDSINREQIATMLYSYSKFKGYDLSQSGDLSVFPDNSNVSAYAKKSLQWAVGVGFISGTNGKLDPQGSAVRAQCAAIMMRYLNVYEY
ncbi:alpha/beta fold hydrolase [Ohessyouella blattaphilus]|uniref:Alpha/beta fold hydrolase n=1 Tax=Ohessyouella blattaphilus TaxID=2949333 RepID=A0ABT1EI25_9FIRM|nr:alpha/beta fold hydrolase [Ohessyouella blattaphilus]MCP1110151.1 alpha/beta fold hydrolase [Ohessyouella blattaphilus]MCR8563545.1 alpha/beta fold hydrolase [Ohessyouella blattaphilus]